MTMEGMVKDALKYPFSSWKIFFILGILIVISDITYSHTYPFKTLNVPDIWIFLILSFLINFLIRGYQVRMIKFSIYDTVGLPKFNHLVTMFIDGVKLNIIGIVYFIPIILINLIFYISPPQLTHFMLTYPLIIFGINGTIPYLYSIAIIPIATISIGNMVWNDGKLIAAFNLKDILKRIHIIGWIDLITWCIMIGVIVTIITYASNIVFNIILRYSVPNIMVVIIYTFLTVTYLEMFSSRAIALIYMHNSPIKYLLCEECRGYYELKPDESPEDYEQCQCGGKLKHTKKIAFQ